MARLLAPLAAAVVAATIAAPARAADAPGTPAQTAFINEQIAAKWKEADIKRPAARASDSEFLRRVFIDVLGRVATSAEFADFEADAAPNKRAKLVHRIMTATDYKPRVNGNYVKVDNKTVLTFDYADEFAEHWANVWTIWLMGRTVDERYREQMRVWMQSEMMTDGFNHKVMVEKLLTATGKSNDNGAVNFIAQQLGDMNPQAERMKLGTFDAVPVTSRTTRLFLGLQTQCTQCHDHPSNKEWVQSDFWGVNAYFRQVSRTGTPTARTDNNRNMMALAQLELGDNPEANSDGIIYYERRDGQNKAVKPTFLKDVAQADKGERSDKFVPEGAKSRREALAQYVVKHDNFAKAYVNRMWGHFFGRGLNKDASVDDFGSHNEVVHPELLAKLAGDFANYGYNPKQLFEWICQSDAYQLSHVAPAGAADQKYDAYFARMPLKALSPEVLFESISVATKADSVKGDVKERARARERWLSKLVQQFGDDEGNEMTFNGTVVQALLMMNGAELNKEIGAGGANAVGKAVEKHYRGGVVNVDGVLDELFIMTLNRHITPEERSKLKAVQSRGAIIPAEKPKDAPAAKGGTAAKPAAPPAKGTAKGNPKGPKAPPATPGVVLPTGAGDVTFYQDVFWALLNTNEFMLNH